MGQILRKSSIFQPSVPTRAKSLHPLSLRLIHSKTAPLGKIGRKGALTPRLARTHRNTFQHFSAVRRADFILSTSYLSVFFLQFFHSFLDQRFSISLLQVSSYLFMLAPCSCALHHDFRILIINLFPSSAIVFSHISLCPFVSLLLRVPSASDPTLETDSLLLFSSYNAFKSVSIFYLTLSRLIPHSASHFIMFRIFSMLSYFFFMLHSPSTSYWFCNRYIPKRPSSSCLRDAWVSILKG